MFLRADGSGTTWNCRTRPCEAEHFLSISREEDTFVIAYQRRTLRYPLEFYDEGVAPLYVRLHLRNSPESQPEGLGYSGPVIVFPRKKRFRPEEIRAIWRTTGGRCHICKRRWLLDERGIRGWHVDHVIPHIGGGADTERLDNFRVACAVCNLNKGKGFTEATIRLGLRDLVRSLDA